MSDDKMPADWRLGLCTDEIERLRAERDALKVACRDAHTAEAEIERMTPALKRTNELAEHFERHWYLRGDEIERLRADADRYRWLRGDSCPDHSVRWAQWDVRRWEAPFWTGDLRRGDLDAAIDAARSKEQK